MTYNPWFSYQVNHIPVTHNFIPYTGSIPPFVSMFPEISNGVTHSTATSNHPDLDSTVARALL